MYYYNNELPPQQGWICPKCGRVNAPWKSGCDCTSSQTSGSTTATVTTDSGEVWKYNNGNWIKVPIAERDQFKPSYSEQTERSE